MLDRMRHHVASKPLGFLPRQTQEQRQDYDLAFYLIQWAEEPQSSLPIVRNLVHRLHQACNDNPILYPYTLQHRLPTLPITRARHFVCRASNQGSHGRPVQPPPRATPVAPPVYRPPYPDPTLQHIPTAPVTNTPTHINLTQETRDLLANQQRRQPRQPAQLALTQTPSESASSVTPNQDSFTQTPAASPSTWLYARPRCGNPCDDTASDLHPTMVRGLLKPRDHQHASSTATSPTDKTRDITGPSTLTRAPQGTDTRPAVPNAVLLLPRHPARHTNGGPTLSGFRCDAIAQHSGH